MFWRHLAPSGLPQDDGATDSLLLPLGTFVALPEVAV